MPLTDEKIEKIYQKTGYKFQNTKLLERAMTHSSARVAHNVSRDNEQLEFLGDRVLGLVISDLLMQKYPEALEGELAKRYNALVRKETCCAVAQRIGLGEFVIMSDSERASGGAEKETILADACEAILGAIYQDTGGLEPSKVFITRFWGSYLENEEAVPADAKSTLQEWVQSQKKELPIYKEVSRTGPDHEPVFTTEVIIEGLKPEAGVGNSKRIAEHNAAENMLRREKVWN